MGLALFPLTTGKSGAGCQGLDWPLIQPFGNVQLDAIETAAEPRLQFEQ
jgi:hypothetical protein